MLLGGSSFLSLGGGTKSLSRGGSLTPAANLFAFLGPNLKKFSGKIRLRADQQQCINFLPVGNLFFWGGRALRREFPPHSPSSWPSK